MKRLRTKLRMTSRAWNNRFWTETKPSVPLQTSPSQKHGETENTLVKSERGLNRRALTWHISCSSSNRKLCGEGDEPKWSPTQRVFGKLLQKQLHRWRRAMYVFVTSLLWFLTRFAKNVFNVCQRVTEAKKKDGRIFCIFFVPICVYLILNLAFLNI